MTSFSNVQAAFRTLNIIYGALFLALIVFLVAASLLVSNSGFLLAPDPGLFYVLKGVAIGFTILMLPLAWGLPQKMINRIEPDLSLEQKMMKYQNALIVRFSMAEGVGFLATIIFMLTGDTNLMLVLAIILLFYIMSRPTIFKVAADLKLSEQEKQQLII
ncbi:MAG: hypothetical protein R6U64_08215 [Bacteroidales bacterium]